MSATEVTRVLKANDIRGLGSKILFNFEDLKGHCEEHLERVQAQARKILEDATAQAVQIRDSAYKEARLEGLSAGSREADEQIALLASQRAGQAVHEQIATVIPALQAAAREISLGRDRCLAEWESSAVRFAVAIAEKLLRRTLSIHPEIAQGMIRSALDLALGTPQVRLRLHPADLEILGDDAEATVRSLSGCGEAILISDASISRGGCLVETRHGVIDARLETMLERITDELLQSSDHVRDHQRN